MTGMRLPALLFLATAGCVSSSSAGDVDDDPATTPPPFEKRPRLWARDRKITVEIEETRGPSKVARIDYRIEDGNVYLTALSISGRPAGTTRHRVDLEGESLPDDWRDRVYWRTGGSYYPVGHSAFWDASRREPAHRWKVEFLPSPD